MSDFIANVLNIILAISLADTPIRRLVMQNGCYGSCTHVTFPDILLSWALRTALVYAEAYLFSDLDVPANVGQKDTHV
jgi:hypothetical protein